MSVSGRPLPPGGDILAVDDQPENLLLLEDVLSEEGFKVRLAADGEAALDAVREAPPDCIVLDIMMPRLDGYGVCSRLKGQRDTHFIPILMLTALSEVTDKVRAFEAGADDFLNKPVNLHELVARVRSLVRIKRLRDELDTSETIIGSMIQALESKDPLAAGHSHRVAATAVALARRLGLAPARVELVAKGALLHDVGKIGLPDHCLWSADPVSLHDNLDYRRHPVLGEQILAPFLSFAPVRALVRHHHERRDGSGFPDGLSGGELELEMEVVALANFHDVLTRCITDRRTVGPFLLDAAERGEFRRETVRALIDAVPPSGGAHLGNGWQELLGFPEPLRAGRILVGDDTPANLEILSEILHCDGHQVVTAQDGAEVLGRLAQVNPDLVLVDVNMPGTNGFEVCAAIKGRPETEFLPVVLLTAHHDLVRSHRRSEVFADDFLLQPINRLELSARVRSLLRLRMYFKDLEEHQSVILSLAAALEAKDPYTRGHSERVGILAAQLGRVLGIDDAACSLLRVAGQLHDIGKIGMPEQVLNKQSRLDDEEYATVKEHPRLGELICRPLRSMRAILPLVRHHHERYDGSGYPDGLAGESIPFGARILGLADAYDALTSARSYRKSFTTEEALQLLRNETLIGRWDPTVHAALETMVRRGVFA